MLVILGEVRIEHHCFTCCRRLIHKCQEARRLQFMFRVFCWAVAAEWQLLQSLLNLLQTVQQIASSSADHHQNCMVKLHVAGAAIQIRFMAQSGVTRNLHAFKNSGLWLRYSMVGPTRFGKNASPSREILYLNTRDTELLEDIVEMIIDRKQEFTFLLCSNKVKYRMMGSTQNYWFISIVYILGRQ